MGRLKDFLIQGVGNFNNNFPKLQMPGGGGVTWRGNVVVSI